MAYNFLNVISRGDLEDMLEIGKILLIVGIVGFIVFLIFSVILGASKTKKLAEDESKPQVTIYGTIIEKNVENKTENSGMYNMHYTVEWLLIEDTTGVRFRLRNLKPKEIFMTVGDKGMFGVRGETICSFVRGEFNKK